MAVSSNRKDGWASGLVKELERRVEALDLVMRAAVGSYVLYLLFNKADLQRQESAPYYSEEEIMAVYQDVLVVPVPQSELPNKAELEAIRRKEAEEEDQNILSSLEDRLCDPSVDIQSQTPTFQSIFIVFSSEPIKLGLVLRPLENLLSTLSRLTRLATFCRSVFCQYVNARR